MQEATFSKAAQIEAATVKQSSGRTPAAAATLVNELLTKAAIFDGLFSVTGLRCQCPVCSGRHTLDIRPTMSAKVIAAMFQLDHLDGSGGQARKSGLHAWQDCRNYAKSLGWGGWQDAKWAGWSKVAAKFGLSCITCNYTRDMHNRSGKCVWG